MPAIARPLYVHVNMYTYICIYIYSYVYTYIHIHVCASSRLIALWRTSWLVSRCLLYALYSTCSLYALYSFYQMVLTLWYCHWCRRGMTLHRIATWRHCIALRYISLHRCRGAMALSWLCFIALWSFCFVLDSCTLLPWISKPSLRGGIALRCPASRV